MEPARALNDSCECVTTDRARLDASINEMCASVPVFVSVEEAAAIAELVADVHTLGLRPEWAKLVLEGADPIANHAPGPLGGLLGFDFHLSPDGPRLIEINTNPGGALVNAALRRAQDPCCDEMALGLDAEPDAAIFQVFLDEWASQRGHAPLRTIAIVGADPERQFMLPEFRMYEALFRANGLEVVLCAPEALSPRDGALWHGDTQVDFVYNRSCDFALAATESAGLRAAWLEDLAVLSPNPRAHALWASKRNLVHLSQAEALTQAGLPLPLAARLAARVPETVRVTPERAEALWRERKQWFFKPEDGFGSRGALRGDKLTSGRWPEVVAGGHVAQRLVPPSTRTVWVDGVAVPLKVDVRAYAWCGQVLLHAARIYQGQVTNLRTPGGGFGAVVRLGA